MSVPSVVAKEVDQEGRWLHRVGGISALAFGIACIVTGFVMLKGIFNRMTAYVGIATGIFGIAAVAGSFFVNTAFITIIASTLMTVWILLVGIRLYRLGQH